MSRKTGGQIESDLFTIINNSALAGAIAGTIYRSGTRPLNAKTEDAVVSFMSGQDDQISTGILNLNIYVPDIDNGTGILVKDTARTRTLEIMANQVIQGQIAGEYRFRLDSIIQTYQAEETGQHFVNVRIKFELATF